MAAAWASPPAWLDRTKVLAAGVVDNRKGQSVSGVAADRLAAGIGQRAVVLDQAFERFPGQVEPVEGRIAPLEPGDHAEALGIVVEAAAPGHRRIERPLAGMPEGRMAEIVSERQRLGQVLVEAEGAGQRPGDLGNLDRMGQPRAVVVAFVDRGRPGFSP